MRKYFIGFFIGLVVATSSSVLADGLNLSFFSSTIHMNGKAVPINDEYKLLQYNDHVYVPIRFVAEQMGGAVGYDEASGDISILSNAAAPILTDSRYGISLANLRSKTDNHNTLITGDLLVDAVKESSVGTSASDVSWILSIQIDYYKQQKVIKTVKTTLSMSKSEAISGKVRPFEKLEAGEWGDYTDVKMKVLYFDENPIHGSEPPKPTIQLSDPDTSIPYVEGSGCWRGCIDKAGGLDLIRAAGYTPVKAAPSAWITFSLNYEFAPAAISIRKTTQNTAAVESSTLNTNKITVPQESGIYIYELTAVWSTDGQSTAADATYVFAVEVN